MGIERFYVHSLTRLRAPVVEGRHGDSRDWSDPDELALLGWVQIGGTRSRTEPGREVETDQPKAFLPPDADVVESDRLRFELNGRSFTAEVGGFVAPKESPTGTHHLEVPLTLVEG